MKLAACRLASLLAGLAAAAVSGCSLLGARQIQIDPTPGLYKSATLTYRLDAGRLSEPVAWTRIEGQQISYPQTPTSPAADSSVAILSIEYPHPEGRAGYALAEVVIESRKPAPGAPPAPKAARRRWWDGMHRLARDSLPGVKWSDGIHEAWSLDIPRSDLDGAIRRLGESGYFHRGKSARSGVEVLARLDGSRFQKGWSQMPELDALMLRVRTEGQLVSYVRPPDTGPDAAELPTSALAYRDLIERDQVSGGTRPAGPPPAGGAWLAGQGALAAPAPAAERGGLDSRVTRLPPVQASRRN